MSRVERRRADARSRMLEAAVELIGERGIDGLTMREIGERADIGFGSFYSHFASKNDLIEAVVADRIATRTAAIADRANLETDPAITIAIAHRLFLRTAIEDPTLARLMIGLDRTEALLSDLTVPVLAPVLERGSRSGRFPDADADIMVPIVVGATIAVLRGIVADTIGADAEQRSARALLRSCGLPDNEAHQIASLPL